MPVKTPVIINHLNLRRFSTKKEDITGLFDVTGKVAIITGGA